MPLRSKPIIQLEEADLRSLIENRVPEGLTLDYKRDTVGASDNEKKEFLRDISSFANAAGGHLIFGMDEKGGVPVALDGVNVIDSEKEVLRLEQIARAGLSPVIAGLQSKSIALTSGRCALVVRVPKGLNPPHQVIFQKDFRIYGRNSSGKHPLTSEEIRALVTAGEELAERIRSWRVNRVASIDAGITSRPLADRPYIVVHTVPLDAFARGEVVDVDLALKQLAMFLPPRTPVGGIDYAHNLDGLFICSPEDPVKWSVQIYRTGAIEQIRTIALVPSSDKKKWTDGAEIDALATRWLEKTKDIYEHLAVTGPIAMMVSLIGVGGCYVSAQGDGSNHPVDRDPILLPEFVIETWDTNKRATLHPMRKRLWNALGFRDLPYG